MNHPTKTQASDIARRQWEAAADGWDAHSQALRSWLREPTRIMFDAAGIARGQSVLDIAAGAGDQTLMLAERIGPQGRILATDLSDALVQRLRSHARSLGLSNVEARCADGQHALPERNAFDAAVCRLGLMLMPDPGACLAATHAALRPASLLSVMVFAGPQDNPCIRIVMSTALKHAGMPPRDPGSPGGLFSLGGDAHLDALFRSQGFEEVSTLRVDAPFVLPSVEAYMVFLRSAAAPVMAMLSALDPAQREAAWQDMRLQLSQFATDSAWVGPNTLLITSGRKK